MFIPFISVHLCVSAFHPRFYDVVYGLRVCLGLLVLSVIGLTASAQNVGIGTASPLQRLHVAGTMRTDGALVMQPPATIAPGNAISLATEVSTCVIGSNAPTTGDLNALSIAFTPAEGQVLYIVNADNDDAIFVPSGFTMTAGSTSKFIYLDGAWRPLSNALAPTGWMLNGNAGTNALVDYVGTSDSEDLVIRTDATERMRFTAAGRIDMTGDLINQQIVASYVGCSTNVVSPAPSTVVTAATLGIPTDVAGTTTRSNSQPLTPTWYNQNVCIIDGLTQSITIEDGSGQDNSGVVVLGNVSIRTLGSSTLPNAVRICLWLQRSTDGFVSDVQNVNRVESALACGHVIASDNHSTGNTAVPLVFADMNLAPGTYTYRVVFQGNLYASAGTLNFEALDRSLVLLQIKR